MVHEDGECIMRRKGNRWSVGKPSSVPRQPRCWSGLSLESLENRCLLSGGMKVLLGGHSVPPGPLAAEISLATKGTALAAGPHFVSATGATATAVPFEAQGVTTDSAGNLYVVGTFGGGSSLG